MATAPQPRLSTKALARRCCEAYDRFMRRELWDRFGNDDIFVLALPGQPPMAASVMGMAGEEFGLLVFVGSGALADLQLMLTGADMFSQNRLRSVMLSASRADASELTPPFDRILRLAQRNKGRKRPLFFKKAPDRQPRAFDDGDMTLIATAMMGMAQADEDRMLRGLDLSASAVRIDFAAAASTASAMDPLAIKVSETPFGDEPATPAPLRIVAGGSSHQRGKEPDQMAVAPADVPEDIKALPRHDERWSVGAYLLPMRVADDDREFRALFAMNADGIVGSPHLFAGFDEDEILQGLFSSFRTGLQNSGPGIPAFIGICQPDLVPVLEGPLHALGVKFRRIEPPPELVALLESMSQAMIGDAAESDARGGKGQRAPAVGQAPDEKVDLAVVPQPDDIDGWRCAIRAVGDFALDAADKNLRAGQRAFKRYFGVNPEDMIEVEPGIQSGQGWAYTQWCLLCYRATVKSSTFVERLLADPSLPPLVRTVFEAQVRGRARLMQTIATARDEVTSGDTLTGEVLTIRDRILAKTSKVGILSPVWLYELAGHNFVLPLGPPIIQDLAPAAVDVLDRAVKGGVRGGIPRGGEHAMGRLWHWIASEFT